MAITFVARSNLASGTGDITVAIPTGYAEGDLLILQVESANEAIATPSGWTEAPNSPQSFGTPATSGGVRLGVFYKYASSSESSVVVSDTGDHTTGLMTCWRGVHSSIPFHVTAGAVKSTASTLISCPPITTTINECMIVNFIAINRDTDAESTYPWDNSSLDDTTLTTYYRLVSTGYGGGCGYAFATKNVAGSVSETTSTTSFSTTHVYLTVALKPPSTDEEYSGSGSISQSSSLSANGAKSVNGSSSVSQSSSVSATGFKTVNKSSSISQSQSLNAIGNKKATSAGAISQSSSVVATGSKQEQSYNFTGSCSISQSSTVQSNGVKSTQGSANISQSESLVATGSKSVAKQASVSQSQSLSALGNKSAHGIASVSQPSTLTVTGYKLVNGIVQIVQLSTVNAIGQQTTIYEKTGSCTVSQSSSVQANGRKDARSIVNVSQSSSIQSAGKKETVFSCLVSQSQSVTGQGNKTVYGLASIVQTSRVHASRNAPMSKKNRFNVAFVPKQSATVQASANQGILVQYEKETEGDITMSSPHREEIKL